MYLTVDPRIHFPFFYTAHIPFNFILVLCVVFLLYFSLSLLFYLVTSLFWKNKTKQKTFNIEEHISKRFFPILCSHIHF